MIVTTAGRTNEQFISLATDIAKQLGERYYHRNKISISELKNRVKDDILVVGKDRFEYFTLHSDEPIFFHPNSAMFRIKRILNGEHDPFLEACQLTNGMSFLDCTLGLGSDSIIASYQVGELGSITSIEGNRVLAFLVKSGLKTWETPVINMNESMRRINVVHSTYDQYLKTCPSNSIDVIYFDPMFEESVDQSHGIKGIRELAVYSNLTDAVIKEAKRVATSRIVLKDHWKSTRFQQFGFKQHRRKTASFHFGTIELR